MEKTGGNKQTTVQLKNFPWRTLINIQNNKGSTLTTSGMNWTAGTLQVANNTWYATNVTDANNAGLLSDGTDRPLDILNPYITTYMWKRTA